MNEEVPELNMGIFQPATCQKTNMEPENHPIEKENNLLPKLHFGVPAISFFVFFLSGV